MDGPDSRIQTAHVSMAPNGTEMLAALVMPPDSYGVNGVSQGHYRSAEDIDFGPFGLQSIADRSSSNHDAHQHLDMVPHNESLEHQACKANHFVQIDFERGQVPAPRPVQRPSVTLQAESLSVERNPGKKASRNGLQSPGMAS